jgi:hypothetical protein
MMTKKLSYDKTYMASFIFPLSVTQSTLFILHTAAGDKDGRNDESHGGGDSIPCYTSNYYFADAMKDKVAALHIVHDNSHLSRMRRH